MKLNIWLDIPSKYMEDFYVSVFIIVHIFSERLTDTSCQDFSLWFLTFLKLWLKLIRKISYWIVFFNRPGLSFFLFLSCVIYLLSDNWVLFLKQNVVNCVLSF